MRGRAAGAEATGRKAAIAKTTAQPSGGTCAAASQYSQAFSSKVTTNTGLVGIEPCSPGKRRVRVLQASGLMSVNIFMHHLA